MNHRLRSQGSHLLSATNQTYVKRLSPASHSKPPGFPLQRQKSSKSKSSIEWLSRQARDPFVKQRNVEHGSFRARSAFKLLELDDQFRFLNAKGVRTVVDLGAAPGGWSQVAAQRMRLGPVVPKSPEAPNVEQEPAQGISPELEARRPPRSRRQIIAVDLLPMKPIDGVHFIQGDFLSSTTRNAMEDLLDPESPRVHVILSDMAPNASGNRTRDIGSSLELCEASMNFARDWLITVDEAGYNRAGVLVMKFFQHPELDEFRKIQLESSFHVVRYSKPDSSRSDSSEGYWVCSGFRDTR